MYNCDVGFMIGGNFFWGYYDFNSIFILCDGLFYCVSMMSGYVGYGDDM